MGKQWKKWQTVFFLGSRITADGDCSHGIKRYLLFGRKVMTNLDSMLKKQRPYFANKGPSSQSMVFPVVMNDCESWTIKRAECWRIDVFKLWCWRRLESPLDCKEIQPVNPKGNQSWIFIGGTDAEAEDWRQEEKGTTEDEKVGWHHCLNGHEFEQALGVGDGQGSLACCSPWIAKSWTWLSD